MDLILTLIMCLTLRAQFHKASSGTVKEKDFQCRTKAATLLNLHTAFPARKWHPAPGKWKLLCFQIIPTGLNTVWMYHLRGNRCVQLHAQPSPRHAALWWYGTNETGWKTWLLGAFCSFCVLLCSALKLSSLPMNLQSWEEKTNLGKLGVWGLESEQVKSWGEQREMIPAPQQCGL